MNKFKVKDFGQIERAKIEFGDLTLLIGPQASGKSILLQLFKLVNDYTGIAKTLNLQGYDWQENLQDFLELFFGENMSSLWKKSTSIEWNDRSVYLETAVQNIKKGNSDKVFYIPAQRVMTLDNGWPKTFKSFRSGDPFVVRYFSEQLRLLMETSKGGLDGSAFLQDRGMDFWIKDLLDDCIFHGARVVLDKSQLERRIVLALGNQALTFMTWSAGQREFMPLLLGLYWLLPTDGSEKRKDVKWVVIEEPEMGLHPNAILAVLLLVLELMTRGYKLIISTHSPVLPQAVWAIQQVKELKGQPEDLYKLLQIDNQSQPINRMFTKMVFNNFLNKKSFKTYYFNLHKQATDVQDISSLDPGNENEFVSTLGGLSQFSARAAEVISSLVQRRGK